ncbi:hypothetical protein ZIOFF_053813 [Zingiber officinale]|uniref:Cell morphogenesis protein N-terminal domain-containing protein n=1 Tax=Zingiber officinale TaxID=94328 RepID=A0A8J5F8F9_ZINOF|nr:hypothetical protein ZIOFF_053813 [Zingiber officinale]
MNAGSAAKLIVEALLQRFLPLARRRIETAQAQDGQYLRPSDPAYEQVLDSLAMVARHTPVPLLEALLRWRDSSEWSAYSAPLAFALWNVVLRKGSQVNACVHVSFHGHQDIKILDLKHAFLFHFRKTVVVSVITFMVFGGRVISASYDKVVSQVDYPSLVDLRGLLLDLVAQLLGALSRIRHVFIGLCFTIHISYLELVCLLNRFSSVTERFFMELNTRRIDTSVARSETLSIINGMRYLKLGVYKKWQVKTEGGLNASASFVAKANPLNRTPHKRKSELYHALCNMLSSILAPLAEGGKNHWPPVGVDSALALWYEAVARIRGQLMHWMEKQTKHIAVGFPLVTLLLCLGDPHIFNTNFGPHMELLYKYLKDKNHRSMALDCLHRVVKFYLNVYAGYQPKNQVWDYLYSVTSQLLTVLKKGLLTQDVQHDKLVEFCVTLAESNLDFTMNHMVLELLKPDSLSEAKVIGLRALLAIVMSPSNQQFGLEVFHDTVTKEKSQASLFRSVLKCIPYLIEEVGRSDKITEIIPQHGISIDPGVREEAVQVMNRIVRHLPHRRYAVVRGMATFILKLPDEFPLLIQTSLVRLVELIRLWRACLSEELLDHLSLSTISALGFFHGVSLSDLVIADLPSVASSISINLLDDGVQLIC